MKPFIGAIGRTARLLAIGLGAAIEASTVFQPEEKVVLSYQPEPAAIPEFSMPTEDAAVLYCAYAGQPSPFTIE